MHDEQSLKSHEENPFERHLKAYLKDDTDYYGVLLAFFEDMFKETNDGNTTVVFVARRCFILSLLFLESMRSGMSDDQYKRAYAALCSDGGVLERVAQFARQCAKEAVSGQRKEPRQRFILADDVLIHGRSMSGLLMTMESLFVKEYKRCYEERSGKECQTPDDVIGDMLLNQTTITVVARNNRLGLLRQRYLNLIRPRREHPSDERLALSTPAGWRQMSYQISRAILFSPVPNACFIQSVATGKLQETDCSSADRQPVDRERVRHDFLNAQSHGRLPGFRLLRTTYGGREMDSYVCEVSEKGAVKIILTLRCADCGDHFANACSGYLIPFVFLPRLTAEEFGDLEKDVYHLLLEHDIITGTEADALKAQWQAIPTLRNELVTLVLSQLLLMGFLEEIGLKAPADAYDINSRQILCNYAHNLTVEKILTGLDALKNPQEAQPDSLINLLQRRTSYSLLESSLALLVRGEADSQADRVIRLDENESMAAMEDIIFHCGLSSEKRAYYYARSSISPDEGAIHALRIPTNRGVDVLLREFYSTASMRNTTPLSLTTACTLHMMDAGSLAVVIGKDPETGEYLHCVRPGEQALLIPFRRHYRYMRTLQGFENYCIKLHRHLQEAFPEKLRQFMREYQRCNNLSSWDRVKYCDAFVRDCDTLWGLVNQIYGAGQYCFDYSNSLLDKIIREEQGENAWIRERNWSLECKKACEKVLPGICDDY